MVTKNTSKQLDKGLLKVIVGIFILLCAELMFFVNILTFFIPTLDQFNVFHRYDRVYSITDWNLPHTVNEFIDDDTIKDLVTPYGCFFLSAKFSSTIAENRICYDNLVSQGKTKGYQIPPPSGKIINLYIGKKGSTWNVVMHSVGETKLYEITTQGDILEKTTPLSLKADSLLYSLSHLYAFVL